MKNTTAKEYLMENQNRFWRTDNDDPESTFFTFKSVVSMLEEYASSLPVQEQSKQDAEIEEILCDFEAELNTQKNISGKAWRNHIQNVYAKYVSKLRFLPQEQKDKVTGVSDEKIEKLWEENSVLNNMMGQSFRLMHKEEFVKILKSLLSYKAEQKPEAGKKFTMEDFEEGLMLAGIIPPASDTDKEKLQALNKYEEGKSEKEINKILDSVFKEIENKNPHIRLVWLFDELRNSLVERLNFLSSKAVEQIEPDVKDGFEKVLVEKISWMDVMEKKTPRELGLYAGLTNALSEYRKFSPAIQEAEHKQGVTEDFKLSLELLRDLADIQNGAPLEQHKKSGKI